MCWMISVGSLSNGERPVCVGSDGSMSSWSSSGEVLVSMRAFLRCDASSSGLLSGLPRLPEPVDVELADGGVLRARLRCRNILECMMYKSGP